MARSIGILFVVTAGVALAAGCNGLLGIDEPRLVSGEGSGARPGSGGALGSGDAASGGTDDGSAGGTASGGADAAASGGSTASGGAPASGGADSGSADAGNADSGGPNAPGGVAGEVRCGKEVCRLGARSCCVDQATGAGHCATTCDSATQTRFACDGAEDCPARLPTCCYPVAGSVVTCTSTCNNRVLCGSDADCAVGEYCAPAEGAFALFTVCVPAPHTKVVWCDGKPCDVSAGLACCYDRQTKTASCSATCPQLGVRVACDAAEDCPAGSQCCENRTGLDVALGTSCSGVNRGCQNGQNPVICGGKSSCLKDLSCCLGQKETACNDQCAESIGCSTDADCPGQRCVLVTDENNALVGRTICSAATVP